MSVYSEKAKSFQYDRLDYIANRPRIDHEVV